mgnify:CR=1 FL=1
MDNIGENEALLRSSTEFQKLGDGKKKRRLLREAQIKDGTLSLTPEQIQSLPTNVLEELLKLQR